MKPKTTRPLTKTQRKVMAMLRASPLSLTPRQMMKRLKLPYEYNRFARLYWRCTLADAQERDNF
jgi:hypothetical protein